MIRVWVLLLVCLLLDWKVEDNEMQLCKWLKVCSELSIVAY
jgi:hypothetical protein